VPEFAPGESRIAVATFLVKPAGLPCTAELWLGSDSARVATSGEVPFVSTGTEQAINLPITMPDIEGAHPVYLDVFSDSQLIGAYQALEGVVISAPLPSIDITGFHYVYKGLYSWSLTGLMIQGQDITHIGFSLRNNEAVSVPGISVRMILEWDAFETYLGSYPAGSMELTALLDNFSNSIAQPFILLPGESMTFFSFTPVHECIELPFAGTYCAGCPHYRVRAEVLINGVLAASMIAVFDVQYREY